MTTNSIMTTTFLMTLNDFLRNELEKLRDCRKEGVSKIIVDNTKRRVMFFRYCYHLNYEKADEMFKITNEDFVEVYEKISSQVCEKNDGDLSEGHLLQLADTMKDWYNLGKRILEGVEYFSNKE